MIEVAALAAALLALAAAVVWGLRAFARGRRTLDRLLSDLDDRPVRRRRDSPEAPRREPP